MYAPFETGLPRPVGRGLRLRDAGRPVHQPLPAGQGARPGVALARGLQGVRRGQPALRRHRQGHADLEGRRRHGAVPGRQQPDARRHARPRARAGLPRERRRALRGAARPAPRRLPAGAPGARPQGPTRDRPSGPARTCRRPTSPPRARRPRRCSADPATDRDALSLPALPARLPRPRRARAVVLRHLDPAHADLLLRSRARRSRTSIEIEPGKTLIVKLLAVGEPHADGKRHRLLRAERPAARGRGRRPLAGLGRPRGPQGRPRRPEPDRPPRCPAWSSASPSSPATPVRKGQKLLSIEAMKMETTLYAERPGRVAEVLAARRPAGQDGRAAHQDDDRVALHDLAVCPDADRARRRGIDQRPGAGAGHRRQGRAAAGRPRDATDAGPGPGRARLVVRRGEPHVQHPPRPRRARPPRRGRAETGPGHRGRPDRGDLRRPAAGGGGNPLAQ